VIDEMAGLKRSTVPLTFGQLHDKQIELKMLTSNLSHGQPYLLPHNLENFIFNASEMARFFPDYVVKHLCDCAPGAATQSPTMEKPRAVSPEQLPEGYYFFPSPDNVPVVVGARLSLSFPLLLSALPLYTVSTDAALQASRQNHEQVKLSERDLQKNWFSDGGICSNFPIQFFDAWLPTCPTFGINLTSVRNIANTSALEAITRKRSARAENIDESNEMVYLPQAEDYQEVEWQHLDTLQAFLSAIFGTAQNYRDTMQTNLPSYRERVVQIRLDATEGGLNLTMPEPVIEKIVEKGQKAGEMLGSDEFDFAHHWWVRFLVLAAQLEENAEALQRVLGEESVPRFVDRLKEQWHSNDGHYPIYPYYRDEDWCKLAEARVAALQRWIENWQEAGMKPDGSSIFFRHDAPMPNPVLRVTPEV
jgi:hypothetical protein